MSSPPSDSVQVALRIRPFVSIESGSSQCVHVSIDQTIQIGSDDTGPKFRFDHALQPSATQPQVYTTCVSDLVDACMDGYNATVLAYGQTGSGKTYTIIGPSVDAVLEELAYHGGDGDALPPDSSMSSEVVGAIPRALLDLFCKLETKKRHCAAREEMSDKHVNAQDDDEHDDQEGIVAPSPFDYEVRIQFLELYGEDIRDLLCPKVNMDGSKLVIRDGRSGEDPEVLGASETAVGSAEEALTLLKRGMMRRVTGATAMNAESSRSHAIFTVLVEQSMTSLGAGGGSGDDAAASAAQRVDIEIKRSKFHFVDLAGSERQKRSLAVGKRLKEGININQGLFVLGNVISALGDPIKRGKMFVPYRDSKLTRLLKGSLGGNHKTLMIACCSPSSNNLEESLSCLRYANRAKNIQNNATVNVDAKSKTLAELREQVCALANELLKAREGEQNEEDSLFTEEVLKTMAGGSFVDMAQIRSSKANGGETLQPIPQQQQQSFPTSSSTRLVRDNSIPSKHSNSTATTTVVYGHNQEQSPEQSRELLTTQVRLRESDAELLRIRETVRKTKQENFGLSEEIFALKAEKEFYRLQCPGESPSIVEGSDLGTFLESKGSNISSIQSINKNSAASKIVDKNAFLSKVTSYEREISLLKESLRTHQAKSSRSLHSITTYFEDKNVDSAGSVTVDAGMAAFATTPNFASFIEDAEKAVNLERGRVEALSSECKSSESATELQKAMMMNKMVLDEEGEEQLELEEVAKKYLTDDDDDEEGAKDVQNNRENCTITTEEEDEFNDGNLNPSQQPHHSDDDTLNNIEVVNMNQIYSHRQQQSDSTIDDLSKNIQAKADLITKLKKSQDKFESMRCFYIEKLTDLERQLDEKEKERDSLQYELTHTETNSKNTELNKSSSSSSAAKEAENISSIKKSLKLKEQSISSLRRKRQELNDMSKVSRRNDLVLSRLQLDLTAMKRQKVSLHKEMAQERKSHLREVQKLKKSAMKKERDVAKWKDQSEKKKVQAENYQRMAKQRGAEISKIRSKYRTAEKKLRMSVLKKGVMARAGIDPVTVGRMNKHSKRSNMSKGNNNKLTVNMEKIRGFLDLKVDEIGRKEAIADKIATEWEAHLDLSTQIEELQEEGSSIQEEKYQVEHDGDEKENKENLSPLSNLTLEQREELESLELQLKFKEQLIRKLSLRLSQNSRGNHTVLSGPEIESGTLNIVLDDKDFKIACGNISTGVASRATTKVLFGMVVRERRRVASLVRTCATLDQKAILAEKAVTAKESAFRLHVEEQMQERVEMARQQQEKILSLTIMIEEHSKTAAAEAVAAVASTASDYPSSPEDDESVTAYSINSSSTPKKEKRKSRAGGIFNKLRRKKHSLSSHFNIRKTGSFKNSPSSPGELESSSCHSSILTTPNTTAHDDSISPVNKELGVFDETDATPQSLSLAVTLAKERIVALEKELVERNIKLEVTSVHITNEREALEKLEKKGQECEELRVELKGLYWALQKIRETVVKNDILGGFSSTSSPVKQTKGEYTPRAKENAEKILFSIIDKALKDVDSYESISADSPKLSLALGVIDSQMEQANNPDAATNISENGDDASIADEEIPDWANDIMDDLHLIAQGHLPPILADQQQREDSQHEGKYSHNVFDRLTNPHNFTGVQKRKVEKVSSLDNTALDMGDQGSLHHTNTRSSYSCGGSVCSIMSDSVNDGPTGSSAYSSASRYESSSKQDFAFSIKPPSAIKVPPSAIKIRKPRQQRPMADILTDSSSSIPTSLGSTKPPLYNEHSKDDDVPTTPPNSSVKIRDANRSNLNNGSTGKMNTNNNAAAIDYSSLDPVDYSSQDVFARLQGKLTASYAGKMETHRK